MNVLGRKKAKRGAAAETAPEELESAPAEQEDRATDTVEEAAEATAEPAAGYDRGDGPFDIEEVPDTDGYADFGALFVPGVQGLGVRLEPDPTTGQLVAMTLVLGSGAVQVRALAAPRSGGLWARQMEGLRTQIQGSGGRAAVQDGPFGAELHAAVPVPAGQPGGPGLSPMRFVGVEGPRWMLHGAFMGAGTNPAAWHDVNELFRRLIVVRGEAAMPVGALLQLRAPQQPEEPPSAAEPGDGPTLDSLEPTDRITEVR